MLVKEMNTSMLKWGEVCYRISLVQNFEVKNKYIIQSSKVSWRSTNATEEFWKLALFFTHSLFSVGKQILICLFVESHYAS